MGWILAAVAVIAGGAIAFRREVEYRRRTGVTRPERHDPGENYVPPPPIVGG